MVWLGKNGSKVEDVLLSNKVEALVVVGLGVICLTERLS